MSKKLLIDLAGSVKMSLEESSEGKLVMKGEFGRADVPTENKRIYPRKVWDREIKRIQEDIKSGKVFMELDHPADGKTSLKRVACILNELSMKEDGQILGKATILDNDHGNQLRSILKAGGAIGVSSRGMGSTVVNPDGYDVVQEDFNYMTHDCVADPAVKSSYPTFMEEGVQKAANMAENKEKSMETKVEVQPTEVAVESVTKEAMEKALVEQKETLSKEFSEKMVVEAAELRMKVEAEVKESLLKDPTVAGAKTTLESIKSAIAPYVVSEDVQKAVSEAVEAKDKEIASLKAIIESKDQEIKKIEEGVIDALNGTKKMAIQLQYEREANSFGDVQEFKRYMGESKDYASVDELTSAVLAAKKTIAESRKQERIIATRIRRIEESYKNKVEKLEAELAEKNKSLAESLVKEKTEMAKLYVEDRIKGNPNAPKLRTLLEGVSEKAKIDEIISQYNVATPSSEVYNSIRSRLEGLKNTTLVESQLNNEVRKDSVVESVDDEIKGLIGSEVLKS